MSTLPGTYNFRFIRGTTWSEELIYRDSEGTRISLTGIRARLVISDYTTGVVLLNFTTDPGGGLSKVDLAGEITWALLPSTTTTLNPDNLTTKHYKYRLDFEDTNPGGSVFPHLKGSVIVEGT